MRGVSISFSAKDTGLKLGINAVLIVAIGLVILLHFYTNTQVRVTCGGPPATEMGRGIQHNCAGDADPLLNLIVTLGEM